MATGNSADSVGAGELDSEQTEWLRAHEALSRLAKERARADAEEGRWLLAALRSATHVHLGFGSFAEYIERTAGDKPRSTQEKLRVAEALEQLPLLAGALEQGSLHWSCARELTRVAVPETEEDLHHHTVGSLGARAQPAVDWCNQRWVSRHAAWSARALMGSRQWRSTDSRHYCSEALSVDEDPRSDPG
jgi:hypothetical protein